MVRTIDGKLFADMIFQGAQNLSNHADLVDSLNVYPVPDGDTGTNMNLTMTSGKEAVEQNLSMHVGAQGKTFAKGLLMGARGNSGVILSQIFRGFCNNLEELATIDAKQFAESIQTGVKTAYNAIMKPVEGTILTVAKDAGAAALEKMEETDDCIELLSYVVDVANQSLENTPNLLPVLKEVGVVDSGGKGLVLIYEGFLSALKGETIPSDKAKVGTDTIVNEAHDFHGVISTDDIKYGYCTEMMVRFDSQLKDYDENQFREDMSTFGDSLLVVSDDEIVKVHVHTEKPGEVFNYGQGYGELIKLKVENMREQHREVVKKEQHNQSLSETVDTAIITISMGEGISELFKSMGATNVINGGQTMNPSTQDIIKVIEQTQCERAIILPNNKNILMASEQAADLVDADAVVIPTKSIPQGLAALFNLDSNDSLVDNKERMVQSLETVNSGAITYAVRDSKIDGVDVKENDFIGLLEDKIVATNVNQFETIKSLLSNMIKEDSEIITIIEGLESTDDNTQQTIEWLEEQYPEIEIDQHDGQQPVYPYLFAVE
ncbi:fatty acid kinase catalytic subunit FakA [Staphylococcus durrellii]|uniref:fatty acid kinase catalytic subunit FakA n=1 Tax=Staphylococcus durrellii TaxID=2781773 RepID=UPI0018A10AC7|nr:fatty acid kinase catalytic subunit FakA [Staphylococcus durrellii]MBF7017312.1 DAK2 domain-containing protein [Staphylococcus durrellii]